MEQRDRRDREREHAPLRQAEDAIGLDSTGMTVDEVVEQIMKEIKKKIR
jgi:cytidylate kinase